MVVATQEHQDLGQGSYFSKPQTPFKSVGVKIELLGRVRVRVNENIICEIT